MNTLKFLVCVCGLGFYRLSFRKHVQNQARATFVISTPSAMSTSLGRRVKCNLKTGLEIHGVQAYMFLKIF